MLKEYVLRGLIFVSVILKSKLQINNFITNAIHTYLQLVVGITQPNFVNSQTMFWIRSY